MLETGFLQEIQIANKYTVLKLINSQGNVN